MFCGLDIPCLEYKLYALCRHKFDLLNVDIVLEKVPYIASDS